MPYIKLRTSILFFFTAIISACNLHTIQPNQAQSNLNNQDNLFNILDPDIKTEEQAFAKGEALYSEGKSENALFYYLKTIQFNNKNVKALERIASIHNRGDHPELAIKIYKDILAIDSNNLTANENLGLHLLENGQSGKAKQYLSTVVQISKNSWKAHNGLGVIADLEHKHDEAIAHYESALEIEPSNPMLLNNLGYSHYLAGNPIKAKHLFTQALNFDKKYKRAIHNLSLIEIKNGNFTAATALFNRIMSVHESYNNIGYICMLNGQYAAAEEYLRRAIDESPVYFPKAHENLKTLMSLKQGMIPYEMPLAPESDSYPVSERNLPDETAPSHNQAVQSKSAQIKSLTAVKDSKKKTVDKLTASSKKTVAKQKTKTTSVSDPATRKKDNEPPQTAAKSESQSQTLTTKPADGSETTSDKSKTETSAPVPTQLAPAQAEASQPPQKADTTKIKGSDQSLVNAQPELPYHETSEKKSDVTESNAAGTNAKTVTPVQAPVEEQESQSTSSQASAVSQESEKMDSTVKQTTVNKVSNPPQPKTEPAVQIQDTAKNEITGDSNTESNAVESKTEISSPAPATAKNQKKPSLPDQTGAISQELQKVKATVNQAAVNKDPSPPQSETAPAVQIQDKAKTGITKEPGNTAPKPVENKAETATSATTDAVTKESQPIPAQTAPVIPEPRKN